MTHFAQLAEEQLRPDVHRIDREGYYPEAFLRALGAAGGFSAHAFRPEGLAEAIRITMAIGKHCGSTAFLVWCQNTCIWYLRNTSNVALRDRHLAEVVEAKTLGATAFSNPMKHYAGLEELRLKGRRVSGGYRVTGSLPWVSNLGLGHLFGTVFELEEEKIAALISVDEKTVRLGPSGQFIALEGTATHSLRFEEAFVPDSDVLGKPADPFVNRIRPGFILLQLGIGFGIIEGALDDIAHSEQNAKPADNYLPDGRETLRSALEGLIAAADRYALEPLTENPDYLRSILRLRLETAQLAHRASYSAVLHAGASGFLSKSAPQRRLREALFFAILTPSAKQLHRALHSAREKQ